MDIAAADLKVFKRVARPAVYTPLVGPVVDDTFAMVGDLESVEDYQVEVIDGGALLTALRAHVGRPKRGEQFLIDGRTWIVEKPLYSNDPSLIQMTARELTA